jgi:hypothetical protein
MRWYIKPTPPEPRPGDKRTIEKFAWLPTRMSVPERDGSRCIVWLEVYENKQIFTEENVMVKSGEGVTSSVGFETRRRWRDT